MTDMTSAVQKPTLAGAAPVYTQCTAADKFAALPNSSYLLHYKNGATPQATAGSATTVVDSTSVAPAGSSPAAGYANSISIPTPGMLATTESVVLIDNSNRFRDGLGFINLVHPGTLTTMTVAIIGPV